MPQIGTKLDRICAKLLSLTICTLRISTKIKKYIYLGNAASLVELQSQYTQLIENKINTQSSMALRWTTYMQKEILKLSQKLSKEDSRLVAVATQLAIQQDASTFSNRDILRAFLQLSSRTFQLTRLINSFGLFPILEDDICFSLEENSTFVEEDTGCTNSSEDLSYENYKRNDTVKLVDELIKQIENGNEIEDYQNDKSWLDVFKEVIGNLLTTLDTKLQEIIRSNSLDAKDEIISSMASIQAAYETFLCHVKQYDVIKEVPSASTITVAELEILEKESGQSISLPRKPPFPTSVLLVIFSNDTRVALKKLTLLCKVASSPQPPAQLSQSLIDSCNWSTSCMKKLVVLIQMVLEKHQDDVLDQIKREKELKKQNMEERIHEIARIWEISNGTSIRKSVDPSQSIKIPPTIGHPSVIEETQENLVMEEHPTLPGLKTVKAGSVRALVGRLIKASIQGNGCFCIKSILLNSLLR